MDTFRQTWRQYRGHGAVVSSLGPTDAASACGESLIVFLFFIFLFYGIIEIVFRCCFLLLVRIRYRRVERRHMGKMREMQLDATAWRWVVSFLLEPLNVFIVDRRVGRVGSTMMKRWLLAVFTVQYDLFFFLCG